MSENTADPAERGHWAYTMYPRRAENQLPPHLKRELEAIRKRWDEATRAKPPSSSPTSSTSS